MMKRSLKPAHGFIACLAIFTLFCVSVVQAEEVVKPSNQEVERSLEIDDQDRTVQAKVVQAKAVQGEAFQEENLDLVSLFGSDVLVTPLIKTNNASLDLIFLGGSSCGPSCESTFDCVSHCLPCSASCEVDACPYVESDASSNCVCTCH